METILHFYTDYRQDADIPSQAPQEISKAEFLQKMERVLQEEGNFIGLVDPEGVTLQFLVNDDRTIRIDIPIPIQKGSYTKTGNLAECQQLVDLLGEEVDYESLPDLAFEEWG